LLEPKVFYTGDSLPTGLPAGPSVFDDWSVGAEGLPPGLRTVRAVGSNGAVDVNVFVGAPSAVHDFVHRIEILTGAGVPVAGIEIIVRSAESGTRELTRVVTDAAGKAEIVLPGTGASQIGISEEWVSTTPGAEGWVLLYVLLERDVPKRTRFGGVSSS
jgi:hypothetical protein